MRNLILILLSAFVFQINIAAQEHMSGKVEAMEILEKAESALDKRKYRKARNHLIEAIKVDWELVDYRLTWTKDYFKKLKKKKRHWRKVEKAFGVAQKGIDLALRNAVMRVEERELSHADIVEHATRWAPYRSVASLYLWKIAHWEGGPN